MSGGNFHDLTIDADGRLFPSGPLILAEGETMIHLYAWVFQLDAKGAGATCVAFQDSDGFPKREEWTTRADPVQQGRFVEGYAVAMAMAVSKLESEPDAPPKIYYWSETKIVRSGGGSGGGGWKG